MIQAAVIYVAMMLMLFLFCRLGEELTQQVSSLMSSYQQSRHTPIKSVIVGIILRDV
jgi:hypothetical protein